MIDTLIGALAVLISKCVYNPTVGTFSILTNHQLLLWFKFNTVSFMHSIQACSK